MATSASITSALSGSGSFIPPPILPSNPKSADWEYFRRTFENYLKIVNAVESQKLPIFLNCLGPDGLSIYDGLPEPKDIFQNAVERFDEHFTGRTSVLLLRKQFYEARQMSNESATDFACRLRRISKDCNFGSSLTTMLRDIFVVGVRDDRLGERLLAESADTLTFDNALVKAESFERARTERGAVNPFKVHSTTLSSDSSAKVRNKPFKSFYNNEKLKIQHDKSLKQNVNQCGKTCYRCGSKYHLADASNCPAIKAECKICNKKGHFARVCKSQKVNQINEVTVSPNNESIYSIFAFENSGVVRNVRINDIPVTALADTGAEVNVLPNDVIPRSSLSPTSMTIKAWGNFSVPVIGLCKCTVTYKNHSTCDFFYVVDLPSTNAKTLLTYPLCKNLGIMNELANNKDKAKHAAPVEIDTISTINHCRNLYDVLHKYEKCSCKAESYNTNMNIV